MKAIKKYTLIIFGSISLLLGVIGIFLPILPTTPFLILAVFCYLRSSEKLHLWLINNKILGIYINNYINYRAIHKRTKIYTMIFLWLSLIISMIIISKWWIVLLLFSVGAGVSIHILTLKNIEKINK